MKSAEAIIDDNYDPVTARFLSPDPLIQDITSCQSFNSYSYCLNNPLKYSDPSGYIFRRPEEPYPFFDMGYINNLVNRITPGGGGGGYNSYVNSYGNQGYHYNENDANYYNYRHEEVSWGEVYNNYVKPNSMSRKEVQQWLIISKNVTRPCYGAPPIGGKWISLGEGKPSIYVVLNDKLIPNALQSFFDITIGVYGKMYSSYNWIQTYSYNGNSFALDGSYKNGFYYEDFQIPTDCPPKVNDADMFFYDCPNADYFFAYLTLAGKFGDNWESIATFSWGYSTSNGINTYFFHQTSNPVQIHLDNVQSTLNYFNR